MKSKIYEGTRRINQQVTIPKELYLVLGLSEDNKLCILLSSDSKHHFDPNTGMGEVTEIFKFVLDENEFLPSTMFDNFVCRNMKYTRADSLVEIRETE